MLNTILLLDTPWGIPCPWWWLFSLLSFLLGALLYWWFFCRKKQEEIDRLTKDNEGLRAQVTNMEKDYVSLKYQYDEAQKDMNALRASLSKCESDKVVLETKLAQASADDGGDLGGAALGFAAGAATARGTGDDGGTNYAAVLGEDNLQIVEGVGPKIEGLLKDAGITTWAALGAASVDTVQKVLDDAGSRYRLADPKSWPRQAELAAQGKWDELIEYQKFLDGGSEKKGDFQSPSKVEKLIAKKLGFSNNPEDLKIVEGIGPKIEGLLKDAGIKNWTDLANASEDRLKEVLAAAGDRYRLADPTTWAKQASLAAEGKWSELSEYQEFLDGGKSPGK